VTKAATIPAATGAPGQRSYLTLRRLLSLVAIVLSGPLMVLGFVVGLGPEAALLIVGLDLLLWGRKAPARWDQIGWSNVVVLGSMSRPKVVLAAAIGAAAFLVSAVIAAPPPPPPVGALTLSRQTVGIGENVQAQMHFSGEIAYAVFRDSGCRDRWKDAGRKRFVDLPVPPSTAVEFTQPGRFYWQATLLTSVPGARVTSGCVPVTIGDGSTESARDFFNDALVMTASDVPTGALAAAQARLERGIVFYELHPEPSCSRTPRPVANLPFFDGSLPAAQLSPDAAGTHYWKARTVIQGETVAVTACIAMEVPKNRTTLVSAPLETAAIGVGPLNTTTLGGATSGAQGTITYTLYTDANCTTKVEVAGSSLVQSGRVLPANPVTITNAGSYFQSATYGGDENNEPAASGCTSIVVNKNRPTLASSSGSAVFGGPLPGPRLAGASTTAGGMMTYQLFKDPNCTQLMAATDNPVSNGTFAAPSVSRPGVYGLRASYSGDTNNEPATAACWSVEMKRALPVLSVALPPSTGIGTPLRAAASLTRGVSPTGTIRYTLSNSANCLGLPQVDGGTIPVSGSRLESNAITFTGAGTAYWKATYSGDDFNESVTSECVALAVEPNRPTVNATLAAGSVAVGVGARMTAALAGATANAGGRLTFTTYDDGRCTAERPLTASVRAVVNAAGGDSETVTYGGTGIVWWQAAYSGDANNIAAKSTCLGLTVTKARPAVSVRLSSNNPTVGESVRVLSALTGASPAAGGTMTFSRHASSACSTSGATSLGTVTVTNAAVPLSSPTTLATTGAQYWQAAYSGDANNEAANSGCIAITVAAFVDPCGAPSNPFRYTFCGGSQIYSTPATFCTYFNCISTFSSGIGYVIQCQDLTFSRSGGRQGSCSTHGGERRTLFAP